MVNVTNFHNTGGTNTLIDVPFESPHKLQALTLYQPDPPDMQDLAVDRKFFKIRLADSENHRNSASMLINKMYSWRGYGASPLPGISEHPNRVTLVASDNGATIGTITLAFDSEVGLLVDELYKQEVDRARRQNRRVCEFIKLAVDRESGSKMVLASLFHIAYIYARILGDADDVFIEVNPRHVAYYRRMLGFEQAGEERMCRRVNAPAVLLRLDFAHADKQIAELGGRAGQVPGEKSLYPYFFSKKEEEGIARRIAQIN
ncbi:MAG: N-acetyltransferase [Pseudomonadota bacterium]